jgi:hypothetical protein
MPPHGATHRGASKAPVRRLGALAQNQGPVLEKPETAEPVSASKTPFAKSISALRLLLNYPAFASSVVVAGGAAFIRQRRCQGLGRDAVFLGRSDGEAEIGVERHVLDGREALIRMPCVSIAAAKAAPGRPSVKRARTKLAFESNT